MAKSLSKIKDQIARLQKEADAIQSSVIARIRREIAQHGLTAEHLFGAAGDKLAGGVKRGAKRSTTAKASRGSAGTPKFADSNGNTWHGIGKRPKWVHEAIAAGHSLNDFLTDGKVAPAPAPEPATPAKAARKKVVVRKKAAPAKKSAKSNSAAKPARKAPAKAAKTVKTAKTAQASPKKAPTKRASRKAAVPEAQASPAQS